MMKSHEGEFYSMQRLEEKKCVPCTGETPPLKHEEIQRLRTELGEGWNVVNDHHIEKTFKFKNFRQALHFTNKVGRLAEHEGHHPDIYLAWGKVRILLWTHVIDALSENDFIMGAKIDKLRTP